MNKYGLVLGVAVAATLVGCKSDEYMKQQAAKKRAAAAAAVAVAPVDGGAAVRPVDAEPIEVRAIEVSPTTTAPAPTHAVMGPFGPAPAATKPASSAATATPAPAVAASATTAYIVQKGDTLSKISKRYNIKLDSIRNANPQVKNDMIQLGQTIQLPGVVEVGAQTVPEGAIKAAPAPKPYAPFSGETKEYTVKSGDTLGAIAYSNGINIRQLKEMNGLTDNMIRVGQKMKIPAVKPELQTPAVAATSAVKSVKAQAQTQVKKVEPAPAPAKVEEAVPVPPVDVEPVPAPAEVASPVETAASAAEGAAYITHVAQEGDDIAGLSITYDVDPGEIRAINNFGPEVDMLSAGMEIKLPASAKRP